MSCNLETIKKVAESAGLFLEITSPRPGDKCQILSLKYSIKTRQNVPPVKVNRYTLISFELNFDQQGRTDPAIIKKGVIEKIDKLEEKNPHKKKLRSFYDSMPK